MKKNIIIIALLTLGLVGCDAIDSLLDTTNYQKYDTSNFPRTEKDAEQIITSIYSERSCFYIDPENSVVFMNMIASDDMFGGGSTSNTGAQATDRLMSSGQDNSKSNWKKSYMTLNRANYALEAIPTIDEDAFSSLEKRDYLLGQAHFLRAWTNWELAEKFETFPLILSTEPVNNPRATVDEIYEAITNDLKEAINLMPAKYGYSQADGESGRATKYAAEAALGRIFMFYTGFYGKDSMFGVTKDQVISYLKDVRDNSKFGLEADPREIWPNTNDYSSGVNYNTDFGTYSNRENLHWVGNRSKETIWGCHFSMVEYSYGSRGYNRMGEYTGLRNSASSPNALTYPYGIGYTNGTVNTKLVEEWHEDPDYGPADKRLWGSLFAVDNAADKYSWLSPEEVELPNHPGNDSKEVEKSMFHNKKYMVSVCYSDASKSQIYKNFFYAYPGFAGSNSNQFDNRNDVIYIRYADVLLMLDELEKTVTGMNKLRERAGLKPYGSYSFENLQKERRYEFCFEGTRWTDLRRWYPKDAGKIIAQNQTGAAIEYRGKDVPGGWADIVGNGIEARYALTRGFWNLSTTEISLSEDVLVQTPGFTENDTWLFGNGSLPYFK